MPDTSAAPGLAGLDRTDWLKALDAIGEERGYFEPLGEGHSAIFTDEGPVLLVTFETVAGVRARPDMLPLGFELARPGGWSQLTLLAHGQSWFRDARVYGYFDRLVDDGFFEDFDRVIFWGEGMCGYAACAFSVVAPGATVIAVQPQATLDPRRAGWDRRFRRFRRLSFTDRYGYAPDMAEAADRVFLFYDPMVATDAAHVALFHSDNVRPIRCPCFGRDIGGDLRRMQLLRPLMDRAASATGLVPGDVHRALRARSDYRPYLRNLVEALTATGNWARVARVSRLAAERTGARRFAKAYVEALARLEAEEPESDTALRPSQAARG